MIGRYRNLKMAGTPEKNTSALPILPNAENTTHPLTFYLTHWNTTLFEGSAI